MDVDANMIHGWPPTLAALTACVCVGRLYATTLSEGVSRFIPIYAPGGPSWLDGKDCIVLDYSETSLLAQWILDEIRQIEPGLYLGKVYWQEAADRLRAEVLSGAASRVNAPVGPGPR
jgi:hypothetical protein